MCYVCLGCGACGKPKSELFDVQMICLKCGAEVSNSAGNCPKCGAPAAPGRSKTAKAS